MSTIEKITGTLHSLKGPKRRFPGFSAWMTGNGAPPESAQIRTSRLRALHLGTINGVGGFALNRNFSPDREYFVSFRDEGSSKFVDIIMPDKTLSVCLKENGQYFRSGKKELLAPKPLTPNQQEHGIQITALLTRVRAGDQQAAIKLLAGFEMLIEKLAYKYGSFRHPADELKQISRQLILELAYSSDHTKLGAFVKYVETNLGWRLFDFVRKNAGDVYLPDSVVKTNVLVRKTTKALVRQLVRRVTDEERAAAMGISIEELHQRLLARPKYTFIDAPASGHTKPTNLMPSDNPSAEDGILSAERNAMIRRLLNNRKLSPNERRYLELKLTYPDDSDVEIAKIMELTQSRISQLHAKSFKIIAQSGLPLELREYLSTHSLKVEITHT